MNIWSLHSIQLHFVFEKKGFENVFILVFLNISPNALPTVFGVRVVHV